MRSSGRRGSVGWILRGTRRTGWQSLARFLSLARVMAEAYLLAFEDRFSEVSRSHQALPLARMVPPPVASMEPSPSWHCSCCESSLIPAESGNFLRKNVLEISPG